MRRRINRVFVASSPDAPQTGIAYYSLSAGALAAADLPEEVRRRLLRFPVPVVLLGRLGRLAIAKSHQGKGLGSILLADALQRIAQACHVLAVFAVVVEGLGIFLVTVAGPFRIGRATRCPQRQLEPRRHSTKRIAPF